MRYVEKIKPETIVYGVVIIVAAVWVSRKVGEVSDKYNPFDSDNKVYKAAEAGYFGKVLEYSNPILAISKRILGEIFD